MSIRPSQSGNQPHPAKQRASLMLSTTAAVIQTLFLGWLLLSGWFCYRWWQDGYSYAAQMAKNWLNNQTAQFESVFYAENSTIKKEFVSIRNHVQHAVENIPTAWLQEEEKQALATENEWQGSLSSSHQPSSSFAIKVALQHMEQNIMQALWLLFAAAMIMLFKLVLLLLAVPLFLLAISVGLSDGLMQRAIRTASLGRESAYVFHKLMMYFPRIVGFGLLLFILMPVSTHAPYSLLLLAAGTGMWTAQTASRFKKYL